MASILDYVMPSKSPRERNKNAKKMKEKAGRRGKPHQERAGRQRRVEKKPIALIDSYETWLFKQRPKPASENKEAAVSFFELDTREQWIRKQPIVEARKGQIPEVTPVRDSFEKWIAERVVELQSRPETIEEEREEEAFIINNNTAE